MRRKHISLKTKLAATLRDRGEIPYDDAKLMTEDQIISLYRFDHNILHETEHQDRDKWWNFTPMLIKPHREKTKCDAKIIAKSRRIRENEEAFVRDAFRQRMLIELMPRDPPLRKLRSRGFDKTRTRKFSGKVVRRK